MDRTGLSYGRKQEPAIFYDDIQVGPCGLLINFEPRSFQFKKIFNPKYQAETSNP